jgi:hypothetical protein
MGSLRFTPEIGGCDIGNDSAAGSDFDFHLKVTVIHTHPEGTLAALRLARDLTRDLGLRLGLVALQLVPFRLPIEEPMVSTHFLRQRQSLLVANAGLSEGEVDIQVLLCRNERKALALCLSSRSVIVVGGRRRWWRPERKLEKWLLRMRHRVLFAEIKNDVRPPLLKHLHLPTPPRPLTQL